MIERMRRRGSQIFGTLPDGTPRRRIWTVDIDDFGYADFKVWMGDLDGSGEAPGVQIEFEHVGCPGGAALSLSGREAKLVSRAIEQASDHIKPHENLRIRKRKWERKIEVAQPEMAKPVESILLGSTREAEVLARILNELPDGPDKKILKDVITQLELPF